MNHDAIIALYPNVAWVDDGTGAFDKDGNKVEIDLKKVNAWVDPNKYQRQRAAEYPSLADQLDALWKGGDAAAAMQAQIMAIKAKYPKGAK